MKKKNLFYSILSNGIRRIRILIYKLLNPYLLGHDIMLHGIPTIECPEYLEIGSGVSINKNVFLHCAGGIKLGNHVTLSYGCTLLTTGYQPESIARGIALKKHEESPIVIEDNVWIGANAIILPGVHICKNTIIAAGAIVAKNIKEEGWLYAGIPAKPIKKY